VKSDPEITVIEKEGPMKLKQVLATASLLVLSILGTSSTAKSQQDGQYRLAHANGDGTLKVGSEQFKIGSVVVKLLDDRKAEITLVSDITFFLSGTWSQNEESPEAFDLQITGGATPGGLDGKGKLTLVKDSKDIRLILKGKSRTTKRNVEVYFVGK
jgi:hypothetical protein